MKRKLVSLMILMLGLAFSGNAIAADLGQGKIDVHGFITQGYLVSDYNNFMADTDGRGTLQYNEAGINFAGDVSDRLRIGIQFIARDLGKMGNKEVAIDWAVADYNVNDWLNFRAGRGKLAYGLYNYERDVDMLRTSVFLPQSVYTEGWRDSFNALNGFSAYGYVPVGLVGNLTYHVDYGVANIKSDGGEIRQLQDTMPKALGLKTGEADPKASLGGQLALDTVFGVDGLKVVASGVNFEMNVDSTVVSGPTVFNLKLLSTVGSVEYARGNFVFAAEYMNNNYEMNLPTVIPGVGTIHKKFDAIGYYGSVSYRFTDWFELGTYYSEYYRDKNDKSGRKAVMKDPITNSSLADHKHAMFLKDLCISARFDITPNWIFKLEGHMMEGAALLYSSDGNTFVDGNGDIKTNYDKYWRLLAAKMSYSF